MEYQFSDTSSNLWNANAVYGADDTVLESDTGHWKIANGSTAWQSLPYASGTTEGALTYTSGTALQLTNTTEDATVYLLGTVAAGTVGVAYGPTSGVATGFLVPALTPIGVGQQIAIKVPAGQYIKITVATATVTVTQQTL